MPFDVAPQEVKVGRFQNVADLMLLGCTLSTQCTDGNFVDHSTTPPRACAIGAVQIGMEACGMSECRPHNWEEVNNNYVECYGGSIMGDNDSGRFTREQIAARIAAL